MPLDPLVSGPCSVCCRGWRWFLSGAVWPPCGPRRSASSASEQTDHDYIQAVASDMTTDHPSIVLEVFWSDEPHADLSPRRRRVDRGSREGHERPAHARRHRVRAQRQRARDRSGCLHHHRHYATPNARPRPAADHTTTAARSAKYPSICVAGGYARSSPLPRRSDPMLAYGSWRWWRGPARW